MSEQDSDTKLGKVFLPASGTGVGRFEFIVDSETGRSVSIGSLVTADTKEGPLVGTVIDMRTVGTARDAIAEDLAGSYEAPEVGYLGEAMVATVQVMLSENMRPPRAGAVRPATADEIARATGADKMDWKIPVGVVELLDGSFAPIYADGNFILGPEGAHILTLGTSGLASKSSFTTVLLKSIFSRSDSAERKVGVLAFNVKGDDLLFLDGVPAAGYELNDKDKRIYAALGIEPTPFGDVTVYAPSLPAAGGTRSSRADAVPLSWDLVQILPYLRYLYPWISADEKAQSFLAEFRDILVNGPKSTRVDTFAKLSAWFDELFSQEDVIKGSTTTPWRSHHIATLRRMRRLFDGLVARSGGLIMQGSHTNSEDVPDDGWNDGQMVVVDIAGMDAAVQGVVVARTIERLLWAAEAGTLGVDHLVIFADELNVFAPATGGEMDTVRKVLQRVATQGRYAGVSLFGAAQQASKIDPLLRDQAGSRAIGNMPDAELSSGAYGKLSAGLIERLATLPKGQMAFMHYSYRAPVVLSFPRPAWKTGKAKASADPKGRKAKRGSSVDVLELSRASTTRLIEGIPAEAVESIIASSSTKQEAIGKLNDARTPDMKKIALHEPKTVNPLDPFALD